MLCPAGAHPLGGVMSATRQVRGRVSRTARVSWATANLEEADGKVLAGYSFLIFFM